MSPITLMILGCALLGLAAWAIVSIVDPRRRAPRSVESDGEATGRRYLRLFGLILGSGAILAAAIFVSR